MDFRQLTVFSIIAAAVIQNEMAAAIVYIFLCVFTLNRVELYVLGSSELSMGVWRVYKPVIP